MFPLTLFVSASDIYKSWIMRFSKWIKAKRNRDFRHTVDMFGRLCEVGLGGIRPGYQPGWKPLNPPRSQRLDGQRQHVGLHHGTMKLHGYHSCVLLECDVAATLLLKASRTASRKLLWRKQHCLRLQSWLYLPILATLFFDASCGA